MGGCNFAAIVVSVSPFFTLITLRDLAGVSAALTVFSLALARSGEVAPAGKAGAGKVSSRVASAVRGGEEGAIGDALGVAAAWGGELALGDSGGGALTAFSFTSGGAGGGV